MGGKRRRIGKFCKAVEEVQPSPAMGGHELPKGTGAGKRDRTTGKKKPRRDAIQALLVGDNPRPGTMQWTCG